MRVLLLTPPMIQLNTPYPATAYLTGFLRTHAAGMGVQVTQADPAIELFLRIFSRAGLDEVIASLGTRKKKEPRSPAVLHLLKNASRFRETVEPVVRFLQGRDPSLAMRIVGRDFLPEGPRFQGVAQQGDDSLAWAFGSLGTTDLAKYLASLYIDDLADAIQQGVDPHFELSRYAEKLAVSAPTFDALQAALHAPPTVVDGFLDGIAAQLIGKHRPDLVGLTAPFPGNVYGAFRIARAVKAVSPGTRLVLGGGYVNTELRQVSDPRVFDYFDFITLDDGERPLLTLIEHLQSGGTRPLFRTFVREGGRVVWKTDARLHDIPHEETGTPTYDGLPLDSYLSLFEMLNPMHRLWSDGRWNKLTVAHGCYWKKCTFCDVSLDYINRYEPASTDVLVDRIVALVKETGQTGFHFVDEAAPPAGLRALARRLIERQVAITWWANIRFEKTFTPELARLLARSGCIAMSGGLEVASNRILDLIDKGVTVEQVARVTRAFTDAGIMVHAYLMYGFPTQTEQETIDSLERVRQLFEEGCIQSAYWHRFAATAHSPVGMAPQVFGIRILPQAPVSFARNELAFEDPTGCDHDSLGEGLRTALYNYMHGLGIDADVRSWFAKKVPAPRVPARLIKKAVRAP